MAKTILRNCFISVNAVTLSDHVSSVEINMENDDVDLTAFGATVHEHAVGLGEASIVVNFFQDFAAGSVHATLKPVFDSKAATTVIVRPDSAAASATNPQASMQALMMGYNPLAGAVGEASQTQVTFQNGSPAGITWTP